MTTAHVVVHIAVLRKSKALVVPESATVQICMVAERSTNKASTAAMATPRPSLARQPTLAEEIDEIERAELVTTALQATVEPHGMTQHRPTGQKPLEQETTGVPHTPKRTPKIGKTPSPVRVDKDGKTWTLEDDDEGQEEEEEKEEEDTMARSSIDPRARSGRSSP